MGEQRYPCGHVRRRNYDRCIHCEDASAIVGYVVVAREGVHSKLPESEGWTFVDGRYGLLADAQADARVLNQKVPDMQFRVATIHLMPAIERCAHA